MNQFPHTVQLETTGVCPAHCSFCPHSATNGQQQARMSEEMFRRLVDEMAAWETPPAEVLPFLLGDPFADWRMPGFCCYVNKKLPDATFTFFTTGTLFSDRLLQLLGPVRQVQNVFLSVHHSTAAEYEAELGIKWEKMLASVRRFLAWNREHTWARNVYLLRVQDGDPEKDRRFTAFCEREFPGVPVQLSYRYNWAGTIDSHVDYRDTLDIVCPRHSAMCVQADGRVPLCCLDGSNAYSLGDTRETSLSAIYNGERALSYRTRHKRESAPCSQCNVKG